MDAVTNLCGISARPRSVFALAAGLLLAALSSGAPLAAQQPKYEELPLDTRLDDERSTLHREIKTLVAKIHRGDTPLEPDAGKFDAWYTRYLFPKMTQISNLAEIPTLRQRFLQSDLERSSSQAAHDRLVRLTLTNMQAVAQGNYHPAARHNAMLIIGELNGREAIRVGNAQPPLPYVDAVNVMLEELESETQIDAVRVAALIGLLRHVELDRMRPSDQRMPEAGRVRFLERMLAIASAPPPAGRSPEGHAWMQRRAVQIIGELGSPGAENAAVVALRKLAADNAQPLDLRTQAAESLGKIIYPTLPAETGAQMASELALVLHASCKAELDRLMREKKEEEEYKKRLALLGGGGNVGSERGGFRGLPGSGSPTEGPDPDKLLQWANVRARLLTLALRVRTGLAGDGGQFKGIAPLVTADPGKQTVTVLDKIIADMVKITSDSAYVRDDLIREFVLFTSRLDPLLPTMPEPEPEPAGGTPTGPDEPGGDVPGGDLPG